MSTKDYRDFLESNPQRPPVAVSNRIFSEVHRDLSPLATAVFFKLFAVHAATAIVTLSFCPQLGTRIFGEGPGLMSYFMIFGHLGCMMACGFFFLAASLAVAAIFLRPEELRVIRNHRWAEMGSLAILSLGFFLALNPDVILSVAITWLMGALGGAFFALELGWRYRVRRLGVT